MVPVYLVKRETSGIISRMALRLTGIHLFTILLVGVLVLYGSNGLRGTDQYWYVGDTQSIIDGDTSSTTTIFFPGPLLREQTIQRPNYVLHNSFMLPMAAFLGQVTGAYAGWIILNFVFHVLISFCVFFSGRRFLDDSEASLLACLYLVSPIAVWQTINPLLEMSLAAVTGVCVFAYIHREKKIARYLLAITLSIGVVSHPIFIIPALSWLLVSCTVLLRKSIDNIFYIFTFTALLVISFFAKDNLFPSSFQPTLEAIVSSAVPGKSNMFWHYSDVQFPIDFNFIFNKFVIAVSTHFTSLKFSPFFMFTNLAVVGLIYLMFFKHKNKVVYIVPAVMFLGLYAAMIVLQQTHPRYQQIVAPVTFVVLVMAASELNRVMVKRLVMALLIPLFVVDAMLVHRSREESIAEKKDIDSLISVSELMGTEARVVAVDVYPHNPITYVLAPREILSVRTDLLSKKKIEEAIQLFSPTHVISTKDIDSEFLSDSGKYVQSVPSVIYKNIHFYEY